jgi:hypothetical protein
LEFFLLFKYTLNYTINQLTFTVIVFAHASISFNHYLLKFWGRLNNPHMTKNHPQMSDPYLDSYLPSRKRPFWIRRSCLDLWKSNLKSENAVKVIIQYVYNVDLRFYIQIKVKGSCNHLLDRTFFWAKWHFINSFSSGPKSYKTYTHWYKNIIQSFLCVIQSLFVKILRKIEQSAHD